MSFPNPFSMSRPFGADSGGGGSLFRAAVNVATTVNLGATYNNGSSGVGATLTNSGSLAALVIDGVSVSVGNYVLVKNQSASAQNGWYVVTAVGSGSVAWILTRSTLYDQPQNIIQGDTFVVIAGTQAGTLWILTTAAPYIIGTTGLSFTAFQITGLGTMAVQNANAVAITGGTIAGALISNQSQLPSAIDAAKIANGTVSSTEFQYLSNVTSDIQTQFSSKLSLSGGTMTGSLLLDGDPVAPLGAATRQFVLSVAGGVETYTACNVSTTANLVGVYDNGTAGVGATFTMTATGEQTIDGEVVQANLRYLIRFQDNLFENGIYICTVAGALGIASIFTRATDFDEPSEILSGKVVSVLDGDTYADYIFRVENDVTTIGTDPIVFSAWSNPSNFLIKTNNLSDISSVSAARANLELLSMALQASTAVSITGGVMTGMSQLGAYAPVSSSLLCTVDGINNFIGANAAGSLRFAWGANGAESTANAGYNPCLFLYDDAGLFLSTAMFVSRASGNVTFNFDITAANLTGDNSGDQFQSIAAHTLVGNPSGSSANATSFGIGTGLAFVGGVLTATQTSSGNIVRFDATVTAAQLNSGIATLFETNGVSYRILNLWINGSGSPFSGGGGNEGILITDGYTQYAFGNSTSVSSGLNSVWGSSSLIFPLAGVPINTPTNPAPNANLIAVYWPGTDINYTTGEIVISGLLQVV